MARHGTHAEEYFFYKVLIYNYLQKWGGQINSSRQQEGLLHQESYSEFYCPYFVQLVITNLVTRNQFCNILYDFFSDNEIIRQIMLNFGPTMRSESRGSVLLTLGQAARKKRRFTRRNFEFWAYIAYLCKYNNSLCADNCIEWLNKI